MRRVIGVAAFIGFVYSLFVHISAYLVNSYVGGTRGLVLLQVGAVIGGGLLLAAVRGNGWDREEHTGLAAILNYLPWESRRFIQGLYLYAMANGYVSLVADDMVRILSGYWLAIYLVVAIYCLNPSRHKNNEKVKRSLGVEYYFYDRGIAEPKQKAQAPEQNVQAPEMDVVSVGRQRISAGIKVLIRHGYEKPSVVGVALIVVVIVSGYLGVNLFEEIPGLLVIYIGAFILWAALVLEKAERMGASSVATRPADSRMTPLTHNRLNGVSRLWRR